MRIITLLSAFMGLVFVATASAQDSGCDVQLSGTTKQHLVLPAKQGGSGASSDFWSSAGLKKSTNEKLDKALGQKATSTENSVLVGPLVFGCRSEDGKTSMNIYTTQQTGSDHIVFGPKEYELDSAWNGKKGHIGILLLKINDERYSIEGSGKLNVTKFDNSGVAGTFELNLKNKKTSEPAKLNATFNLPCNGDVCKK
jgi:hypothetical protein